MIEVENRGWKSRFSKYRPAWKFYLSLLLFQNQGKSGARRVRTGRQSSAYGKKRNLDETIARVQEDNVRLRKKHDLIKYQRNKVRYRSLSRRKKKRKKIISRERVNISFSKRQQRLRSLLDEYSRLMSDKMRKIFKKKIENPLRNVSWKRWTSRTDIVS